MSLALRSLLADPSTLDATLGLLLALAMADFAQAEFFTTLRGVEVIDDALDLTIIEFQRKLKMVVRPEPLHIVWSTIHALQTTPAIPSSPISTAPIRYGLYKLFEALFHINHRNQGVLSSLNLVQSLFGTYYQSRDDAAVPERERQTQAKLLRRLLEMGATTEDARRILQKAVIEDPSLPEDSRERLDSEVLEIIRYGMKSRWSEHFSFEGAASLVVHDTTTACKGLPSTGFTIMVRINRSRHYLRAHQFLDVVLLSFFSITLPSGLVYGGFAFPCSLSGFTAPRWPSTTDIF